MAIVDVRGAAPPRQHADVPASQAPGSVAVAPSDAANGLTTFDAAWTAIRETYVDESRTDADWDALRAEFRPRAARAATPDEVRNVLRDLLTRIGHSHFDLLSSTVRARLDRAAADPSEVGSIGRISRQSTVSSSSPASIRRVRRSQAGSVRVP